MTTGRLLASTVREISTKYHHNSVRLCLYDYKPPGTEDGVTDMLSDDYKELTDTIIQWAEEDGIYVILNYHTNFHITFNLDKTKQFWDYYGPRYQDMTHVLYEVTNEPLVNNNADVVAAYDHVRALAPDTHIINWSFAGSQDLLSVSQFQALDIDYTNASIGYHAYTDGGSVNWQELELIRDAGFPVMMTEFDSYGISSSNDVELPSLPLQPGVR